MYKNYEKLNENIKIDLHIHSKASELKTGDKSHVINGDIDHLELLFNKLEENEIKLFSITDHNRFDLKLYQKIFEIIEEKNLKINALPGIEFDVLFEENKRKFQLNAYFDIRKLEDLEKIQIAIDSDEFQLKKEDQFYDKKTFLSLLNKIGLNVILIASQNQGIKKQDEKGVLSNGVEDINEYFAYGFLSALEVSKMKVESLILKDFKDMYKKTAPPTIRFSDCHEWDVYPKHNASDDDQQKLDSFTTIKAKPNFKGLLFSLAFPETRLNRKSLCGMSNKKYIENVKINDIDILLDKSVNVIIGDNGVGKSFFINSLIKKTADYKNNSIANNKISTIPKLEEDDFISISQNEFANKLKKDKNSDFFTNCYPEVDFKLFKMETERYFGFYKERIIKLEEQQNTKKEIISNDLKIENKVEVHNIIIQDDLIQNTNKFTKILDETKVLIEKAKLIAEYIENNELKFEKAETLKIMDKIINFSKNLEDKIQLYNTKFDSLERIKNIIITKLKEKNDELKKIRSKETEIWSKYSQDKDYLISKIISLFKNGNKKTETSFGAKIPDKRDNSQNGFIFSTIPKINDINDAFQSLIVGIFNKDSFNNFKKASNLKDAVYSVTGAKNSKDLWKTFDKNIENTLKKLCEVEYSILEENGELYTSGTTIGEMSLVAFKQILYSNKTNKILLIDQPEDNISNKKISEKLINIINLYRDNYQIIMVTHNPLLAINLDPDNLIFIDRNKGVGTMDVISGSLDYESEDKNIMNIVLENIEGSKSALSSRMELLKYEDRN